MNFNVIRIESQNLGHNTFPTYFVDLMTVRATTASANLFRTEDKAEAREWAHLYAAANGLRVEDETLVQEMVAAYKARGYVAEAKYKAMSDRALERSIMSAR